MSTTYQRADDVPTTVIADRLEELARAIVFRGQDPHVFDQQFSMSTPCQVDRDADMVLIEAAKRLREMK